MLCAWCLSRPMQGICRAAHAVISHSRAVCNVLTACHDTRRVIRSNGTQHTCEDRLSTRWDTTVNACITASLQFASLFGNVATCLFNASLLHCRTRLQLGQRIVAYMGVTRSMKAATIERPLQNYGYAASPQHHHNMIATRFLHGRRVSRCVTALGKKKLSASSHDSWPVWLTDAGSAPGRLREEALERAS